MGTIISAHFLPRPDPRAAFVQYTSRALHTSYYLERHGVRLPPTSMLL